MFPVLTGTSFLMLLKATSKLASHLIPIFRWSNGFWQNSSFSDDSTLVGLARTLRLIISVQDLASMNKALRADWQARQMPILMLVRDLATAKLGTTRCVIALTAMFTYTYIILDTTGVSVPRSVCRELVLSIVQGLPPSLIDQDTLSKVSRLSF